MENLIRLVLDSEYYCDMPNIQSIPSRHAKYIVWGFARKYHSRITNMNYVNGVLGNIIYDNVRKHLTAAKSNETSYINHGINYPAEALFLVCLMYKNTQSVQAIGIELLKELHATFKSTNLIKNVIKHSHILLDEYANFITYHEYVQIVDKYSILSWTALRLFPQDMLRKDYFARASTRSIIMNAAAIDYYGSKEIFYQYVKSKICINTNIAQVACHLEFVELLDNPNIILGSRFFDTRILDFNDISPKVEEILIKLLKNFQYVENFDAARALHENTVVSPLIKYINNQKLFKNIHDLVHLCTYCRTRNKEITQIILNDCNVGMITCFINTMSSKFQLSWLKGQKIQICVDQGFNIPDKITRFQDYIKSLDNNDEFFEMIRCDDVISIDVRLLVDHKPFIKAICASGQLHDACYGAIYEYDSYKGLMSQTKSAAKV